LQCRTTDHVIACFALSLSLSLSIGAYLHLYNQQNVILGNSTNCFSDTATVLCDFATFYSVCASNTCSVVVYGCLYSDRIVTVVRDKRHSDVYRAACNLYDWRYMELGSDCVHYWCIFTGMLDRNVQCVAHQRDNMPMCVICDLGLIVSDWVAARFSSCLCKAIICIQCIYATFTFIPTT
jgi:hypothetical protein